MNRSGCKNCPVNPCETALYRGSVCMAQRHKLGLGDPMTNADRIRAMSDEELAEFISTKLDDDFYDWPDLTLQWLKQPAEEADHA